MKDLSAIVLTFNEEMHIGRCLHSLNKICETIFVIDSFSNDRTTEIAKTFGATVVCHEFKTQAQQLDWAISNIRTTSKWFLRVDADEYLSDQLIKEFPSVINGAPDELTGLIVPLKYIFLRRPILHGGRHPMMLLRCWRRGHAHTDGRLMDERIILRSGLTAELKGEIIHEDVRSLSFFVKKHDEYASREAIAILSEKIANSAGTVDQKNTHSRTRQNLKKAYGRVNPLIAPFLYFGYRYLIQMGFLDGWQGLIYHTLQGFWYRFLVGAKIFEIEVALKQRESLSTEMHELLRQYGLIAESGHKETACPE
jgi:glycosyltransferase involved in cell wall biosynthesis